MGAFNTFFNYRTSHHTKTSVKMQRAQARRAAGKRGDANDLVMSLFTRGARKAASTEATHYAQLGANATPVKVEPGWYPDHDQRGMLRYWDGQSWTDQTVAPKPNWV